jgi:hypothetical protein
MFQLTDIPTAITIYYAHIYIRLRYGILAWGLSRKAVRTFKLQKWAVRITCRAKKRDSCRNLFKKLQDLPLPCIFIFCAVMLIRDHESNLSLVKNLNIHNYHTRCRDNFAVRQHSLSIFNTGPVTMNCRIYN